MGLKPGVGDSYDHAFSLTFVLPASVRSQYVALPFHSQNEVRLDWVSETLNAERGM